ncbi:methyltransferase [Chloroflexota bacterium]
MQVSQSSYQLLDMLTQYQTPAIIMSAHKLGIFRELGAGPTTLEDLAFRLSLPERSLGILLRACVAERLLALEEDRFALSPLAEETLVPGEPGYLGRLVDKEAFFYDAWSGLTDCVRTGQAALAPIQTRAREEPETTRKFLVALDDIAALFGGEFAHQLDLSGCRRLLDVGGGVGSFAIALAQQYPDLEVTILDLPEVVPWARDFVAKAGMGDRIAVEPVDFLVDPLPAGYDTVLLANIFHDHPSTVNQGLLAKAHDALEPGGRVVVYEFLLEPDRLTPAISAVFAVMMLVENQGGNVYTGQEIIAWMAGAGYGNIGVKRLSDPSPMGLVVGYKQ